MRFFKKLIDVQFSCSFMSLCSCTWCSFCLFVTGNKTVCHCLVSGLTCLEAEGLNPY